MTTIGNCFALLILAITMIVLQYIGKSDLAEPYLKKYGLKLETKGLSEIYLDLAREDIKETINLVAKPKKKTKNSNTKKTKTVKGQKNANN